VWRYSFGAVNVKTVRIVTRLVIAILVGWPLTFAPVFVTEPLGIMHAWGYAHSGLPLVLYPFAVWLVFALLGHFPGLKVLQSQAKEE
jgi:hypothetical protein